MSDEQKKLVEENTNLVYYIINRYYPTYMYDEDVSQEGMLGLVKAAIKYDSTQGKFSTFASNCILNQLRDWFKLNSKHHGVLSLDYDLGTNEDGSTATFGDMLVGESDVDYIDFDSLLEGLTEREAEVIKVIALGYNRHDTAKLLGITPQYVSYVTRKFERKQRAKHGNN